MSKKILICYISYSGNTQEVATMLQEVLSENHEVTLHKVGVSKGIPTLQDYDFVIYGSFTWGKGELPVKFKNFIADTNYKPDPSKVAVFGTGDTQFGGDKIFCNAVNRLSKFYGTNTTLKIEQSPRGSQEVKVIEWGREIERCLQ